MSEAAEGESRPELSAAGAERLLVSGDAERAASVAEMVLRSARRRPLPRAELDAALAVLLQAAWKLGSFASLETLLTEVVGGVQEMPVNALLLWASIGCEAGEAERVSSALQLRLRLASSGKQSLSPDNLRAVVRMAALEVMGKEGGDPLGAKEWAKQWRQGMGEASYTSLIQELDELAARGVAPKPLTPEIQEAVDALASEVEAPAAALAGGQARGLAGGPPEAGADVAGALDGWCAWGKRLLKDAHQALPDSLREMDPQQLAVGVLAGSALAVALYAERRQICGRLQRARRALLGA